MQLSKTDKNNNRLPEANDFVRLPLAIFKYISKRLPVQLLKRPFNLPDCKYSFAQVRPRSSWAIFNKSVLFLLLIGLFLLPTTHALDDVIKNQIDHKEYRPLILENQLKVLLISDPETDKAAAALDVHVGNGSDPKGWQGLAHFLEHMLFLGNVKYPRAGEYQEFIKKHGGSDNAYTSFDHTNYHFSIKADYLLPALDRFSRFFIDPTFDATFVERERTIVHSEYMARREDDSRRLWAAQKQFINPSHPWSEFAVGSQETLADHENKTAREKLIEFYNTHYSSNIMTLVVLGKESLDQLQDWVEDKFSEIRNRYANPQRFSQSLFNSDLIPLRMNLVPDKEHMSLSFIFPIPSTMDFYRVKPVEYIANLLGHEGAGSLLSILKQDNLAEYLSAGIGYMDEIQGSMEIKIGLTENGMEHIDDIGSLLFQAIRLIGSQGVEQWRYQENRRLADIAFRFREQNDPGNYARSLAARLHRYPLKDVLRGVYIMNKDESELIGNIFDWLRPDNVILVVVGKQVETNDMTDWYQVEFKLDPIDAQLIERWKNTKLDQRLTLPDANPFIPHRLELLVNQNKGEALSSSLPKQQTTESGLTFWHQIDQEFGTPRADYFFSIQSSIASKSAKNQVMTELFVKTVKDQLATIVYPAYLAGLSYDLYRHNRGFSIRISGYQDKQPDLLELILKALQNPEFNAVKLKLFKDEYRRHLANKLKEQPSSQVVMELYRLLMDPYWSEAQRLDEIDHIDVKQMERYVKEYFKSINITVLSHGDVNSAQATSMSELIMLYFNEAALIAQTGRPRIRRLEAGQPRLRTIEVDYPDSSVLFYLQGMEKSDQERARIYLLNQLMETSFYHQLRTVNKAGYIVYSMPFNMLDVPALALVIQSPTFSSEQLRQMIDKFLTDYEHKLNEMDDKSFADIKQGLIARIMRKDNNLTDRSERYWHELDKHNFNFDTRQRLVEAVEELKKSDMLAYFKELDAENGKRELIVQSRGKFKEEAESEEADNMLIISDSEAFKLKNKEFFPEY